MLASFVAMVVLAACTGTTTETDSGSGAKKNSGSTGSSSGSAGGPAIDGQPQGPYDVRTDGKLTIGWVELTADCQSCVKALAEFRSFIEDNDYDWTVETLDSKGDADGAARAIEDFTTRKVDVIVTAFVVLKASGAAIDGANAAKIPVFSLDSGWSPGVVGDVTTNNFDMAAQIAAYLADSLGGNGNVVSIWSDQHYGVVIRQEMLENITKSRYPGIKILGSKNVTLAGYYQESIDAAENFVSRFGDEIDAVYCGFDEPCMAAAEVFEKAGLDVPMFGFDGHQQALGEIRGGDGTSGLVATMAQQFGPFATTVGQWINSILVEGKPVNEVIPVPEVYLPAKLITPLNVPAEGEDGWTVPGYYDVVSGQAELK
ncbi:sugar ABC transporter substrate-binding protein [Nocardioides humi]|uniref:sugar ABC transporter substrate-binding protein n=1 Tax=Nocardioides humi TaxID=449461 RepID=UPI0015E86DA0|nr:sugar ABC transporter substrate-binding protein [Nocardioides humi]